VNILIARSAETIDQAYSKLAGAAAVGCDTETSGLNARYGKVFSVQFSDGEFNVLVPLSEGVPIGRLAEILADPNILKIFHNAKFDLDFLSAAGLGVANVFDTMIAEKVLTRGANQSASLAETLYRYFAVDLEKSHRSKFNRNWDGVWTEELVEYALSDVVHLPMLMMEQKTWMGKLGMLEEFEVQMAKVLSTVQSTSFTLPPSRRIE
jgi:ribonuclease D